VHIGNLEMYSDLEGDGERGRGGGGGRKGGEQGGHQILG
jgi:hypothetical protein